MFFSLLIAVLQLSSSPLTSSMTGGVRTGGLLHPVAELQRPPVRPRVGGDSRSRVGRGRCYCAGAALLQHTPARGGHPGEQLLLRGSLKASAAGCSTGVHGEGTLCVPRCCGKHVTKCMYSRWSTF